MEAKKNSPGHKEEEDKPDVKSTETSKNELLAGHEDFVEPTKTSKLKQVPDTMSLNVRELKDSSTEKDRQMKAKTQKTPETGVKGPDPKREKCRNAKAMRKERKLQKLAAKASREGKDFDPSSVVNKDANNEKTIEDFIDGLPSEGQLSHRLEVKLIRVDVDSSEFQQYFPSAFELFCKYQKSVHHDPPEKLKERRVRNVRSHPPSNEFTRTFKQEYELFKKYQIGIHKETEAENSENQFRRFLVDCPLVPETPEETDACPPTGLGAFHQQYYIDGKLIAVGVLDILPNCVSSKYFFYDPEYSFLSLGTYSALREIYFIRSLHSVYPELRYYYMGFYIHSCQKMRYKGQYDPSYLLCPETYKWCPIKSSIPLLEANKYSRLTDAHESSTPIDVDNALILHQRQAMPYMIYHQLFVSSEEKADQQREVEEYVNLAGIASHSMLLYRG